jgi:hypothetical protein
MKKHRGLKRYYKKLTSENDFITRTTWLNLKKEDNWFNFWKLHFDHKKLGNSSFKSRRLHLDKLFRHFELIRQESKYFQNGFQVWAFITENNSYDDCLFLHTPNPHGEFPHKYSDYSLTSNFKNHNLDKYLESLTGYKKIYGQYLISGDERIRNFCAIYREGVGQSIV